jgi:hypothetical protein
MYTPERPGTDDGRPRLIPPEPADPAARERAQEITTRLTRRRAGGSHGRRIVEIRCPVGRGRIAGLYALDGEVWLWHEGYRGLQGGPPRPDGGLRRIANPPLARFVRDDRELPHPRRCTCRYTLKVVKIITCPCCRTDYVLRCRCDDSLGVVPRRRRT